MTKIRLRGVFPPMMTPFKENEDVDYDAHIANLERWNETKLSGYLVLGSNSETCYLNEKEKIRLVELTVRHAKKDRFLLAGTGMESVRETVAFTNLAADLGVQGALVLTPSYYHGEMQDDAQINFFTRVADDSKIPILIYNVTKFTHINISARAVGILSRHPNIIGIKDSTGNVPQLVDFKRVMDESFNLMSGTVSSWFPALALGISAGIFALANFAPDECSAVQEAYSAGDIDGARKIYERIFPVNTAVTATFGIAGLKYASDLLGYRGGNVRGPLLPLTEEQKVQVRKILETAGLI